VRVPPSSRARAAVRDPIQIISVPIDLGASRRGTDAGPSALRVAGLAQALRDQRYPVVREIDLRAPPAETRDPGDGSRRFKAEILAVCRELAEVTCDTLDQGRFPLVLGGDHSLAMGSVSGVADHFRQQGQDIGVIWLDAHGDMNTPSSSPSGNVHGMPLAHLLGYGDADLSALAFAGAKVRPDRVALVGIRDIDDRERDLIHASGVHTFTMRDIDEQGIASVSRQAIEIVSAGTAGFHLSFDVDVCDPAYMPGSGTLSPGGVSLREAHLILEVCADSGQLRSMDVVELNPFLDQGNVSAETAVSLVQSAFGHSIL